MRKLIAVFMLSILLSSPLFTTLSFASGEPGGCDVGSEGDDAPSGDSTGDTGDDGGW